MTQLPFETYDSDLVYIRTFALFSFAESQFALTGLT